jgi:hypothetical protein
MKLEPAIKALFWVAAVYDGILGAAFLIRPSGLYESFGVPPANHWGYVRFPAALLIVFALMFLAIARAPARNRNLIPYGILLKVSFCSVVFGYWMLRGIPGMWKPFAIADAVFGVLFVWAYVRLRDPVRLAATGRPAGAAGPGG